MDIAISSQRLKENKFVDLILSGWTKVEAAKKVYNVGSKTKGVLTVQKLNDSARAVANIKLKSLSERNRQRLVDVGNKGVEKIEKLMEAKKGIFVMGRRVDEEPDNPVQLGAAKTALEYSLQKPTEKKEITHRTFFDACVRVVETDDEGNIIDGEIVDE